MRQEEMEPTRKHHSESHRSGRRDEENRRGMSTETKPLKNRHSNEITHTRKKHSKSDHRSEKVESSKRQRSEIVAVELPKKSKDKSDRTGHRNSPVQLVYSGSRNTDSSSASSSEETNGPNSNSKKGYSHHEHSKKRDGLNNHSKKGESSNNSSKKIEKSNQSKKHDHSHSRKRGRQEETFEELSDRKKMIELELKALDEEEEAQRKRAKRNPSNHRVRNRREDMESHVPVRTVHIKKEPVSDDESRHHRKPAHSSKRQVHIKHEPLSDDERPRTTHRAPHSSSHIKHERDDGENNPPPQRSHKSNSNRKRRDGAGTSNADNLPWGKPEHEKPDKKKEPKEKDKPDFKPSGKLAEDTNTYNGVVIKYNEPAEARKPRRRWRLYPFKGDTSLPFIPVHRQSAYLLGRSRIIADIPIDHPSCSKQHAVLQFRLTPYVRENGTKGRSVRPYVIDLDSANGTFVNNKKIDPRRYMELFEKDVLKFGFSSRVYVILHEDSKNEDENDDEEEEAAGEEN